MTLTPAAADDRSVRVIRPTQSLVQILSAGLTELWSHKSLFLEMTRLRLKVRYKQSLLGWTWAVLPSLVLMITYTLIFSKLIGLKGWRLTLRSVHFFGSDSLDVLFHVCQHSHRRNSDA